MRTRRRATIEDLRVAIDCLPQTTKVAMLEGIRSNPIIAGAYTDRDGICPMLAAHRNGGRTSLIAFAKAWDRYVFRGSRKHAARRATPRELLVLRTHLEASLLAEDGPSPELAAAIREHRGLMSVRAAEAEQATTATTADTATTAATARRRPRPGDPDRNRELRTRGGWAWMRVFRRYDEYERALALLELEEREAATPQRAAGAAR